MCERTTINVGRAVSAMACAHRVLEDVEVVRLVADVDHVPAVGREALDRVIALGQFGRPVDRDVVVVVEHR